MAGIGKETLKARPGGFVCPLVERGPSGEGTQRWHEMIDRDFDEDQMDGRVMIKRL